MDKDNGEIDNGEGFKLCNLNKRVVRVTTGDGKAKLMVCGVKNKFGNKNYRDLSLLAWAKSHVCGPRSHKKVSAAGKHH